MYTYVVAGHHNTVPLADSAAGCCYGGSMWVRGERRAWIGKREGRYKKIYIYILKKTDATYPLLDRHRRTLQHCVKNARAYQKKNGTRTREVG